MRRADPTVKSSAQQAVAREVKEGRLPRAGTQPCKVCGEPANKWHHWSYREEHWLDVAALCHGCHARVHAGRIPDPTSGQVWDGTRKPRMDTPEAKVRRAMYGIALQKRRHELGLTQAEAGKRARMTGGAWQQLEVGLHGCSEEVLHRMAEALDLRLSFRLFNERTGVEEAIPSNPVPR